MTDTETETELANARQFICRRSLKAFCDNYLPDVFTGWTPHAELDILPTLQDVVTDGGTQGREMDRGTGATTLLLAAALWAGLCEHRRAILVIVEDQGQAMRCTALINKWIAHGPFIMQDFENALFKISECVRIRGQGQNLTIPFRVPSGEIIKPDLCLIDSVEDFLPVGNKVQSLSHNLAAIRITSVE